MIRKESFISDMHNDNYTVIGNNHYKIESHSKTPSLYINLIPIYQDSFNSLVELSLLIACAYGDVG